jgi:L-rhamnose mutarotase
VERIGFVMALRPGAEAEYRRRHSSVWPEMLDELRAAGAGTYSIFLSGDQLFGYLEVEDFDRFRRHMSASEVNERWQADMAGLIDPLTDPETGFHRRLDEVFRLEPIGPSADPPDAPASGSDLQ